MGEDDFLDRAPIGLTFETRNGTDEDGASVAFRLTRLFCVVEIFCS